MAATHLWQGSVRFALVTFSRKSSSVYICPTEVRSSAFCWKKFPRKKPVWETHKEQRAVFTFQPSPTSVAFLSALTTTLLQPSANFGRLYHFTLVLAPSARQSATSSQWDRALAVHFSFFLSFHLAFIMVLSYQRVSFFLILAILCLPHSGKFTVSPATMQSILSTRMISCHWSLIY